VCGAVITPSRKRLDDRIIIKCNSALRPVVLVSIKVRCDGNIMCISWTIKTVAQCILLATKLKKITVKHHIVFIAVRCVWCFE